MSIPLADGGRIIEHDLMSSVDIEKVFPTLTDAHQGSPVDTPLWDALADAIRMVYPEARVVPSLVTGATDARSFRGRGTVAYGAGLLSSAIPLEEFLGRFHSHNERIDVESLALTTQLWRNVLDRLWT